jgi:exodeoxyribonuclease VII large subunit
MTSSSQSMPVLTVTQLTNAIKAHLEPAFRVIWLQGEISNCKLQSSGHLYFSLKDANAQIAAVMFKGDASSLKKLPKDGDKVEVRGELNVYNPAGRYQILVRELRPVGLGELLLRLEELKRKIAQKGWFRSEHKKLLPKFPKRIGVVTSPTGAAIQDILNILTRRFFGFHLILNPVRVQGEEAPKEIARAIQEFNAHGLVDVMIVGRGGGSIEDLWAFNEEIVAEAIFHSRIPIISAVGHETDHCIADYVADVRAPTPSAAAEMVIGERSQILDQLEQRQRRMRQAVHHLIRQNRHRLDGIKRHPILQNPALMLEPKMIRQNRHRLDGIKRHPILQNPALMLEPKMQRLDEVQTALESAAMQFLEKKKMWLEGCSRQLKALKPTTQILHFRQKLDYWQKTFRAHRLAKCVDLTNKVQRLESSILSAWRQQQTVRKHRFDKLEKSKQLDLIWIRVFLRQRDKVIALQSSLEAINPKKLLSKGYSILFSEKDHSVINTLDVLSREQQIRILLYDGQATSTINELFPNE